MRLPKPFLSKKDAQAHADKFVPDIALPIIKKIPKSKFWGIKINVYPTWLTDSPNAWKELENEENRIS